MRGLLVKKLNAFALVKRSGEFAPSHSVALAATPALRWASSDRDRASNRWSALLLPSATPPAFQPESQMLSAMRWAQMGR